MHFGEQRRGQIALRGVGLYDGGLTHGAAHPQHRYALPCHRSRLQTLGIAYAVVGNEDYEQVVPQGLAAP